MDKGISLQQKLFMQIKQQLPENISLVEMVEDVLCVGQDSAYRRISGKTELTITELQRLCKHFNISSDQLLNTHEQSQIVFNYRALNPESFGMEQYLQTVYDSLKAMSASPECELIYCATAIPLFDYFLIDEIADFKMFVWQKSISGFPQFEARSFSLRDSDKKLRDIGRRTLGLYQSVPSIELWNEHTTSSIMQQIEFYCEANLFADPSDALLLTEKLEEYFRHLQKQAELGLKFPIGTEPGDWSGKLHLYHNEVVTADNTIMVKAGGRKFVFLTHCAMNFLNTTNESFCDTTYSWLTNLIKRSSLISTVSEKQRNQFFNTQLAKVKRLQERIKFMIS